MLRFSLPALHDRLRIDQSFASLLRQTRTPQPLVGGFAAPFESVRISRRHLFQYQARVRPIFTETVTIDKWMIGWPEPLRRKLGLPPSLAQSNAQVVLDPATQLTQFFESRWHYGWSTPLWPARGLRTYLHPATALPVAPAVPNPTDMRWFAAWSEPVPVKHWLHARKAMANVFVLGEVPVTFGVSASEINSDTIEFTGIVGGLMAQRAVVAIREIPAHSEGALSAEEEKRHDEAAASVKES